MINDTAKKVGRLKAALSEAGFEVIDESGLTIDCPTCGTAVQWDTTNAFRPFCSDRCKLIDLGAWASEEHKIPVSPDAEDDLFSEDLSERLH